MNGIFLKYLNCVTLSKGFFYLYLRCALACNLIWRHDNILSSLGFCFFDSRTAKHLRKLFSFLFRFILEVCLYHVLLFNNHNNWILRKYCHHAGEI